MKKQIFLSLSLASALVAPNLFACDGLDIENDGQHANRVHIAHLNKTFVLNHRPTSEVAAAEAVFKGAVKKSLQRAEKGKGPLLEGELDRLEEQYRQAQARAIKKTEKGKEIHTVSQKPVFGLMKTRPVLHATSSSSTPSLPTEMLDLRKTVPGVYNQGELGSCTSNACAGALRQAGVVQSGYDILGPSRLNFYYHARYNMGLQEGNEWKYLTQDSGAGIGDVAAALVYGGLVPESMWPYSDDTTHKKAHFTTPAFATQPTPNCYKTGQNWLNKEGMSFVKLSPTLTSITDELKAGRSVMFGINLHNSFMSDTVAKTGMVPAPGGVFDRVVGGHAMLIVGYDGRATVSGQVNPKFGRFIVQNSWDTTWGDKGFCYMPSSMFNKSDTLNDMWRVSNPLNQKKVKSMVAKLSDPVSLEKRLLKGKVNPQKIVEPTILSKALEKKDKRHFAASLLKYVGEEVQGSVSTIVEGLHHEGASSSS